MLLLSRIVNSITSTQTTRPFSTGTFLHDITRLPIKLPLRRNTETYAFLERFRIHLRVDPEKKSFNAEARLDSCEGAGRTKMPKSAFYAVKRGREPGIYSTWAECEHQTKGYTGAVHKKFPTREAAEQFLGNAFNIASQPYSIPNVPVPERAVTKKASKGYFAVKCGLKPGVYDNWADAERMVKGVQGAVYKRFPTRVAAEDFINGSETEPSRNSQLSETSRPTPSHARKPTPLSTNISSADPELDQHRELARSQGFTIANGSGALVVYTDGSSRGNGQRGAAAGSGIWWADKGHARTLNLAERLPGRMQTNNRAELLAIIRALENCPFPKLPLEIRTDSQYSIACITQYLPNWIKNNFVSSTGQPVKNKDMIVHLLALLNQRGPSNGVRFVHVRAHRGEVGNEGADMLANAGAVKQTVPDRIDWFTLQDANKFTSDRKTSLHLSLSNGSRDAEERESGKTVQRSGLTTESEVDTVPIEIDVDPSWLLTEEEMAALDGDQGP
ncbi:hypothetical protein NCC49_001322 [Naganishia albida]|nr:hypothetical protein NCC49_001322 [Naganishia albida]